MSCSTDISLSVFTTYLLERFYQRTNLASSFRTPTNIRLLSSSPASPAPTLFLWPSSFGLEEQDDIHELSWTLQQGNILAKPAYYATMHAQDAFVKRERPLKQLNTFDQHSAGSINSISCTSILDIVESRYCRTNMI